MYLVVVICSKVDGNECKPNDRRRVHCEANILGFVKVFRDLASFKGIQSAQDDQRYVVDERHHQRECGHFAGEDSSQGIRMDLFHVGPLNDQPCNGSHQLDSHNA